MFWGCVSCVCRIEEVVRAVEHTAANYITSLALGWMRTVLCVWCFIYYVVLFILKRRYQCTIIRVHFAEL